MKKSLTLPSNDGVNNLAVSVFEPEGEIKGIVQISHGMIEYMDRYEELAEILNNEGYLCIGNDHLGHGFTAFRDDDLGYMGKGLSKTVVDDLRSVTQYAKDTYGKEIPYYLFGHSMGSFMARRYMQTYGDELSGIIISGTGYTPGLILTFGKIVVSLLKAVKGDRYRAELLEKMAFGSYNSKIQDKRTNSDWLTRDNSEVDKYIADKYCTYKFTINGYETLFDVLTYIQKDENVKKAPVDLPVLFVSGDADPVGNYAKGVYRVSSQMKKAGINNQQVVIHKGARHELIHETDKEKVFEELVDWLKNH